MNFFIFLKLLFGFDFVWNSFIDFSKNFNAFLGLSTYDWIGVGCIERTNFNSIVFNEILYQNKNHIIACNGKKFFLFYFSFISFFKHISLPSELKSILTLIFLNFIFKKTACLSGSTQLVELLINIGMDVNAVDDQAGATPIHMAAFSGYISVTKLLIKCGADRKRKGDYFCVLFHHYFCLCLFFSKT